METIVKYNNVELVVEFKVFGENIPATYDSPAEYVEIRVDRIVAGDVNIYDLLCEDQIDDVYRLVHEKL